MRDYRCRGGLILYRTVIKGSELQGTAVLDISEPVRDYARVSLVSLVTDKCGAALIVTRLRAVMGATAAPAERQEVSVVRGYLLLHCDARAAVMQLASCRSCRLAYTRIPSWVVQVLINGKVSGFFERSNPRNLPLPNIFSDVGPNEEVGQRFPGAHSCLLVEFVSADCL